jgi:phage-related protein
MGDSLDKLRGFPDEVRQEIGYAIYLAEHGESYPSVKHMQGFNAIEIVVSYDGDAFRGVYTTKFQDCIYVLHCFQKKSKTGAKTPKPDVELIRRRLKEAREDHKAWKKNDQQNQE